jgi:hypothetical protein
VNTSERFISPNDHAAIAAVDKYEAEHPPLHVLAKIEEELARKSVVVSKPISADCNISFRAVHVSGVRPLNQIWWIVMHDTEGGTSRSIAQYFTGENSGGSAHLTEDDNDCYRCMRNDQIPWGAPGANYHGFHIEQCGYAKWSALIWSKTHRKSLQRAAYKAAYHCRLFGLPPRFVDAAGLKGGRKGITTHAECTKAFGGNHTDPGSGWPRVVFMGMVRMYYTRLGNIKKIV